MYLSNFLLTGFSILFLVSCAETPTTTDSTSTTTTSSTTSTSDSVGTGDTSVTIATNTDDIGNSPQTGVISQKHFSLLFSPLPVNAIDENGALTETEITVTARVADRNDVEITDEHTINFVTEKALYFKESTDENGNVNLDSCKTINGRCSVTWVISTQEHLHSDNTAQIVAYTYGEEYFKDNNNNDIVDGEDENLTSQFAGDLYVDLNGNGLVDGVPYIDVNKNYIPDPSEVKTVFNTAAASFFTTDTYKDVNSNGQLDGDIFVDANGDDVYTARETYTDSNGNGEYDFAETFTDSDGDGVYDTGETFTDANNNNTYDAAEDFTDADGDGKFDDAEVFVDANDNGSYDLGEVFTDSNSNAIWDDHENFVDADGDGKFDDAETFVDANGNGRFDAAEAFVDANSNGTYDGAEVFVDANKNGVYDLGETIFDSNLDGRLVAGEPLVDGNGNNSYDFSDPFIDVDGDGIFSQDTNTFTNSQTTYINTSHYDFETTSFKDSAEPYLDLNHNYEFDNIVDDQVIDVDMYGKGTGGDGVYTYADGKINIVSANCSNTNFCSENKSVIIWTTDYVNMKKTD